LALRIDGIAVSTNLVFFPMNGSLLGCAPGGCSNAPSTVTATGPDDLTLDATYLYGTTGSTLWKCPLASCSGGTRVAFATGLTAAESIAVDATYAYGVGKCALSGCGNTPAILVSGLTDASDVAVDATYMYWTNPAESTVMRCAVGGCNNTPETIATGQTSAKGIAVDAVAVYWTTTSALVRLATLITAERAA
jgi:hypothetical protein